VKAYAERFVQTIRHACLDMFIVLGERHLRHIVEEFVAYYLCPRPHQGLGNVPLGMSTGEPEPVEHLPLADLVCRERLGGLLKHYERKAA
jgi:putative transposase